MCGETECVLLVYTERSECALSDVAKGTQPKGLWPSALKNSVVELARARPPELAVRVRQQFGGRVLWAQEGRGLSWREMLAGVRFPVSSVQTRTMDSSY
jgi:hypothetical protein